LTRWGAGVFEEAQKTQRHIVADLARLLCEIIVTRTGIRLATDKKIETACFS